jgi:hypothetical protein
MRPYANNCLAPNSSLVIGLDLFNGGLTPILSFNGGLTPILSLMLIM